MTAPRVVPAGQWRQQRWRPLAAIGPTAEWWVHHGAAGTATLATLRSYERYHVATLGWAALGYSWAITGDGTIYEGRGWLRAGAHTSGRNTISHAVLLVGDWTRGTVPQPMVDSLVWLTRQGHRVGALRHPRISGGHREAPGQATACPGAAGLEAVRRAQRDLTTPAPLRPAPTPLEEDDVTDDDIAKIAEQAARAVWLTRNSQSEQTYGRMVRALYEGTEPRIESVDGSSWTWRYTLERLWHRMTDTWRDVRGLDTATLTRRQVDTLAGELADGLDDRLAAAVAAELGRRLR